MSDIVNVLSWLKEESAKTDYTGTFTESDTRARLIDPILAALGWVGDFVKREPYYPIQKERGYLDYMLLVRGKPFLVLEAKKSSRTFSIPEELARRESTTLDKLIKTGTEDLREAIDQCCNYSAASGALYACATNGIDYLFFKPFHPGRPQSQAKVIVFKGVDALLSRLDAFMALLSRSKLESGSIDNILIGKEMERPNFAEKLDNRFSVRGTLSIEAAEYASALDQILRNNLIDLRTDESFERCYVSVPWTRTTDDAIDALIKNQMEYFNQSRQHDNAQKNLSGLVKGKTRLKEAYGKTIILHGPIGIGKSAYLRHLNRTMHLDGSGGDDFSQNLVWAHLDLLAFRDRPFNDASTQEITRTISKRLRDLVAQSAQGAKRDIDPEDWKHLRAIYNHEARTFQKERFPNSNDTDQNYIEELRKYIWNLKGEDPHEHLLRTLLWITVENHIPTVIVLDNSDQLGLQFQEFLYKLASGIEQRSSAVTILCLRTEALASHRLHEHSLATAHERYEVQRPPLVDVLSARFNEIERQIKEWEFEKEDTNIKVALDRISVLLSTLRKDVREGGESSRLLEVAGNGNLRRTLEAVGSIFKLDPSIMDRLVADDYRSPGRVSIHPKYVLRALLRVGKPKYRSGMPETLIPNILTVERAQKQPYTLGIRIIRHIRYKVEGHIVPSVTEVVSDFSLAGFDSQLVRRMISRFRAEGLISVPHMLREISDDDPIRTTRLGDGIVDIVMNYQEYYDAIIWDSLIYDESIFAKMANLWRSSMPVDARFTQMREMFIEYIKSDDVLLQSSIVEQFLEPPARGLVSFAGVSERPEKNSESTVKSDKNRASHKNEERRSKPTIPKSGKTPK